MRQDDRAGLWKIPELPALSHAFLALLTRGAPECILLLAETNASVRGGCIALSIRLPLLETGLYWKRRKIHMGKLMLCVTYTTKPGQRDAFIQKVLGSGVLDFIRGEDGCLRYEYYRSLENEDQVLLLEEWAGAQQQKEHLKQPHMEVLRALKTQYVADTDLKEFFPA